MGLKKNNCPHLESCHIGKRALYGYCLVHGSIGEETRFLIEFLIVGHWCDLETLAIFSEIRTLYGDDHTWNEVESEEFNF